jgi:predicted RNase H-like nuclease (RuvC/YqgF family)
MTNTCLDDYYQELLNERDEEIYQLREQVSRLKYDLTEAYAQIDELEKELAFFKQLNKPSETEANGKIPPSNP